jgi:hypothetical protein
MVAAAVAVGATAAAVFVAWPAFWWLQVRALEKPSYKVLKKLSASAELRRYGSYTIAEAEIEHCEMRGAMNSGFRSVAGYIFGGNTKRGGGGAEKVAMTSPVLTGELKKGGLYSISFVLPSKYTLDTLPVPKDARVRLREVAAHTAAAITFHGGVRDTAAYETKRKELEALLQTKELQADGVALLADYYPPFAPSWMRKREVLIPVKE